VNRAPAGSAVHSRGRPQGRPGSSADKGVAELAADIGRLRLRLARPGVLNHPRISAELDELDQLVAAGLDHRRGRHCLPAGTGPACGAAVRDAAGYSLKPDPFTARTGTELVAVLRRYREWAGNTPFRQMAARTRWKVAHSTMCVALKSDSLPPLKVVMAIVAGCGGTDEDQQAFATAWRRAYPGTADTQGPQLVVPASATGS
jgi:hypothetical protein